MGILEVGKVSVMIIFAVGVFVRLLTVDSTDGGEGTMVVVLMVLLMERVLLERMFCDSEEAKLRAESLRSDEA
jgi:hypothetical protein